MLSIAPTVADIMPIPSSRSPTSHFKLTTYWVKYNVLMRIPDYEKSQK